MSQLHHVHAYATHLEAHWKLEWIRGAGCTSGGGRYADYASHGLGMIGQINHFLPDPIWVDQKSVLTKNEVRTHNIHAQIWVQSDASEDPF